DNDGINDVLDKFSLDQSNGLSTSIPIDYPFLNGNPGVGLFGVGFTGLMTNNVDNYANNFDPEHPDLIVGGAVGVVSVPANGNDALQNNQNYAFQFGVNINQATPPITIHSKLLGAPFFDGLSLQQLGSQSQGIYFGTGDQDNYFKLVLHANQGNPGFQILCESDGIEVHQQMIPVPGILSLDGIELFLEINPLTGEVNCQYRAPSSTDLIPVGDPFFVVGKILNALQNGSQAMAVGIIASSGNSNTYSASWDFLKVLHTNSNNGMEITRINSGGPTIQNGSEIWTSDQYFNGGYTYAKVTPIQNTENDALYQTERFGNFSYSIPVPESGQYRVELHFAEIYWGVSNLSGPGQKRIFDVNVENGQYTRSNLDLGAEFGVATAVVLHAQNISVVDGYLDLSVTTVLDNAKLSGIAVFKYAIVNNPPIVTTPPNKTLNEGESWSYQVLASDSDVGDILSYSASNLPSSLSINSSTGFISGTVEASAGIFPVTLTVTDQNGSSTNANFTITINQNTGLRVTSLILINSIIDTELFSLTDGMVLYTNNLPTSLNIKANASPQPGSVRFGWQNNSNFRTESSAPFALGGDSNGDYKNMSLVPGSYSIIATPYPNSGAGGVAGQALSLSFTIVAGSPPTNSPPVLSVNVESIYCRDTQVSIPIIAFDPDGDNISFSLDAAGDQLPSGLTINTSTGLISGLLQKGINEGSSTMYGVIVRATDTKGASSTIVVSIFSIDCDEPENNPPSASVNVESFYCRNAQVSISINASDPDGDNLSFGIDSSGDALPPGLSLNTTTGLISGLLQKGINEGSSTFYDMVVKVSDDRGASTNVLVSIFSIDCGGLQVTNLVLINSLTDVEMFNLTNGMVLYSNDLPSFVNVKANVSTLPGSVRFGWQNNSNFRTENTAPYALGGDSNGDYKNIALPPGVYTITATPYTNSNAGGTAGQALSLTFTVINGSAARLNEKNGHEQSFIIEEGPAPFVLFPNPARDEFTVEVKVKVKSTWNFIIYNSVGDKINLGSHNLDEGLRQIYFDIKSYNLSSGIYFLQTSNPISGTQFVKVMINK
ncbi:MAG: putative Ig domain-containing protein, partial [Cyclobacteriaceae bacterium]|nr:putative Ig domain-containing protein [Cyclobacteriaceae bacterium]